MGEKPLNIIKKANGTGSTDSLEVIKEYTLLVTYSLRENKTWELDQGKQVTGVGSSNIIGDTSDEITRYLKYRKKDQWNWTFNIGRKRTHWRWISKTKSRELNLLS